MKTAELVVCKTAHIVSGIGDTAGFSSRAGGKNHIFDFGPRRRLKRLHIRGKIILSSRRQFSETLQRKTFRINSRQHLPVPGRPCLAIRQMFAQKPFLYLPQSGKRQKIIIRNKSERIHHAHSASMRRACFRMISRT